MNYFVVFVIIATEMNFLKSFIPCYITTEFFSTIFKINSYKWEQKLEKRSQKKRSLL